MDELDETVLDVAQRQKRAQIMRRYQAKIARSRELAKKRMAPAENIKKRAYAQARQIVRRRVAGNRGAEYEKLGPSEKIAIDRAVEGKQKVIKKLALRLIPRVKQAEQQRLHSFMKGHALSNQGHPEGNSKEGGSGSSSVQEHFNQLFAENFPPTAERSERKQPKETTDTTVIKNGGKEMKGNSNIIQYSKFEDERASNSPAYKAVSKKANKSGISEDILGTVYDRGVKAWCEETGVSHQQYAFARVNSFINQGKSYFNEDADLHEGADSSHPIVKEYKSLNKHDIKTLRNMIGQQHKVVDTSEFKTKDHAISHLLRQKHGNKKVDQAFGFNEDVNEARDPGRAYVAPFNDEKGNQRGWKSSNKWGKVKYWQPHAKKSAMKHAGLQEEEVQQTNENFIDGKGPGKPGDSARHGLKGKSASELRKIRSSETASPRKKQLAHWMLNMHHNEEAELDEKRGLWDNIHAKRKRIKAGSGERMRKPGSEGAPTKQNFRDASESIEEGYDVNSKHYKALTDLDLNTKNRDMTTKNDGYGPLNPMDKKGSKAFWADKAKMWNTTVEAAMEARCGNCAAFNQAPAIMKKMAEGLGPAGEKIQDLSNLGFCELFEFKCAGARTCNKWLVNGPITEEDTGNGSQIVDKESRNSKIRKKLEVVDRKPPHTEYTRQAEIKTKIIDEEGNSQLDPKKRLSGTDSLVKAYKKDTPGQSLDESFNIAFASGVGVTLTAKDLGMQTMGGFALHPSVVEEMERRAAEHEDVDEEVRSADVKGVIVRTASGKTIVRKQKVDRKIIGTGNLTDGKPDDTV